MIIAEAAKSARKIELSPVERLHALVEADMTATDVLITRAYGQQRCADPGPHAAPDRFGGETPEAAVDAAAAAACGHANGLHIKLAAAVEFIHTATLLHDDVVDASSLRRGKLAANIVWGNKPSILVGDFLLSRAFQLMVEAGNMRVLHILASASAVIAEGEVLQLRSANNLATTEEDYLTLSVQRPLPCLPPRRKPGQRSRMQMPQVSPRSAHTARISGLHSSSWTIPSTIRAGKLKWGNPWVTISVKRKSRCR